MFEIGCNCLNVGGEPDYRAPAVLFANCAADALGADFDYADLNARLPANLQSVTTLSPIQLADSGFDRIAVFSNGVVNPPAKQKYFYWTGPKPRSSNLDGWLAKATQHPGSWWPDWLTWLKSNDATEVPARAIGDGELKPIEDAPGSYVKVQA